MTIKPFKTTCLLAIMSLCSCGVTPTSQEIAIAGSYSPSPGKSLVYVYRPSRLLGAAVNARVSMDRRSKGELPNGKFMCLEVTPGPHELLAGGNLLHMNAKAGSCHYFRMAVSARETGGRLEYAPGLVAPILSFDFRSNEISDPPARQEIRKCGQVAVVDAPITSARIIEE